MLTLFMIYIFFLDVTLTVYLFCILQHGLFMKHNICKENQCFGSVSVRCSV